MGKELRKLSKADVNSKYTGSILLVVLLATLNTTTYSLITKLLRLLHIATDNLAFSNSILCCVYAITLAFIFN